ncbi:MAG: hypothetical protein RIB32_00630 [Phycisphaerales bacterium]
MPVNTVARRLAPEDIAPRTYVVILAEINEYVHYDCGFRPGVAVSRAEVINESPVPLEVLGVCLPLVTVRRPNGRAELIDVRRHRLARIDARYARQTSRALGSKTKHRGSKS